MPTRLIRKFNERGQLIESLTTAVFGLVFVSKMTYEYDSEGTLTAEVTWKDPRTIESVKHFSPALASAG